MNRTALVALSALLVVAATTVPVLALPTAGAQSAGDTVPMLEIDGPAQSNHVTPTFDLSAAVANQHDAATARLDDYAFEERIARADGDARSEVLEQELARIERRAGALVEEERSLRESYENRRIDAAEFLRRIARIHSRAGLLRERIDVVRVHAEDEENVARARDVQATLVGVQGPVRNDASAAIHGSGPSALIQVAVSSNATVLSTIRDGTHVREAYRTDRRTTDVTGTIPADELFAHVLPDLVSNVYRLEPQSTNIRGVGRGLYLAVIEAPRTSTYLTVTSYIDGDTRQIFSEVQERDLDRLPPRTAVWNASNGTRLVVNRSFSGGPLRIATLDNETGQPIRTTVVVDGERFRTGSDGVLWTLTPRTFSFPVAAVQPGGNVTLNVRSVPVESVGNDS